MADCYAILSFNEMVLRPKEAIDKARTAAAKAVEKDAKLAESA